MTVAICVLAVFFCVKSVLCFVFCFVFFWPPVVWSEKHLSTGARRARGEVPAPLFTTVSWAKHELLCLFISSSVKWAHACFLSINVSLPHPFFLYSN